jgi:hypothetical protein
LHIAAALDQAVDPIAVAAELGGPVDVAVEFITHVVIAARAKLQFVLTPEWLQ